MTQNINPMDVLKQELDTDQIAIRINCIHKIKIIATLLGPQGIRNTLLPFLDSLIKKQEDEVLFAIAEQIGNLAPLLGNQQMILVPYLQNLSGQDETVVREMAVKSLTNIITTATDLEINNYLIPMIIRLASNQANFTCRVSAANLMCKIYPRAGTNKQKLRQKFTQLSNQQTPMVRRIIAIKIGQMASVYDKDHIITDLIPAFKQLANDDQDLVRVLCLDSLKSLAKVLPRDDNKTHTLPVIIQSAEDKSWRVRLALSKNFSEIAQSFGKQITDLSLIQTFSTLLKDVQNDVKIQAVKSLARFVKLISPDKLNILIPLITTLGKDNSPIVRSNLTSVLGNIVGIISKDLAYQKILPLITDLMKDDNQQVRQGGIRAVCRFGEVIGYEILNSIYPHLKTATEDPKWRVRSEAINAVVTLGLSYQNLQLFMKNLQPLFMLYLKDKAAAVRELAIEKLPNLVKTFGNAWINVYISKLADILNKDSGYLYKISAIYSLKTIVTSPGGESVIQKALNLIIKSLGDAIPNVRFVCVKALKQIGQKYEQNNIKDSIRKSLNSMVEDNDKDVKFYSIEAIQSL